MLSALAEEKGPVSAIGKLSRFVAGEVDVAPSQVLSFGSYYIGLNMVRVDTVYQKCSCVKRQFAD
jgi:hypothetical protein